jgi:hypothetical protein
MQSLAQNNIDDGVNFSIPSQETSITILGLIVPKVANSIDPDALYNVVNTCFSNQFLTISGVQEITGYNLSTIFLDQFYQAINTLEDVLYIDNLTLEAGTNCYDVSVSGVGRACDMVSMYVPNLTIEISIDNNNFFTYDMPYVLGDGYDVGVYR